MRKNKKLLLCGFSGVAALCFGFGFVNTKVAYAEEETFVIPQTVTGTATEAVVGEPEISSFKMDDKASIRLDAPHGIRFEASISEADLAKLPNTAKFGTLILPTSVLGETAFDLATVETLGAVNVEASVWRSKSTATALVYSGVLVGTEAADFPVDYYGEELSAVSYVTYADSEGTPCEIYTNVAKRSMAYVAGAELKANATAAEEDKLDEEDVTFLTEIVDEVVDSLAWANHVSPVFYLGESVSLDVEGANGIPVTYTITSGNGTITDGVLTATEEGYINVTAKVGSSEVSATFTAYQDVKSKIAASLKGNQIAMFDSADYLELASDLLVKVSGSADPTKEYEFQHATGNPLYKICQTWGGSGKRVEFPVQNTYTSGYLKMRLAFDNEQGVNRGKVLKIWKYDETDASKCITIKHLNTSHQYLYIPMSELVDENNVLKGLQFMFNCGGWSYIGEMEYSETGYAIEETITSQDILAGETYDVSYTATKNGVAVDGATISISDKSVLTIENGKLTALKTGTSVVTLKYTVSSVSSWIPVAVKRIEVTVTKGYLEQLADTITGNEIHMWDNAKLYPYTMGDLIIDNYNNPWMATSDQPKGWYFDATNAGPDYSSIRVNPASGGSGFRLTFAKKLTFDASGYLKIRIVARDYQILHLYNYDETDSTKGLVIKGSEQGWTNGWATLYVPIESFLNENGQIEGIQFAFEAVSGWQYFGAITYVAELPA